MAGHQCFQVDYYAAELQSARRSLFGLRRFCGQAGGALNCGPDSPLHVVLLALLGCTWLNFAWIVAVSDIGVGDLGCLQYGFDRLTP
jgi:hypothetical protein